jgi:hypothetical protein
MSDYDSLIGGLRRVVTANDNDGKSHILIDGPPAAHFRSGDIGGLHEIWTDTTSGPMDPTETQDRGQGEPVLSPPGGGVKIRWFSVGPTPADAPPEQIAALTRQAFIAMGAEDHQPDTRRHPAMHTTHTIDAIILLRGRVRLILDTDETEIGPGDVVVQRATNHAWAVIGDEPAIFVAVLVDRS